MSHNSVPSYKKWCKNLRVLLAKWPDICEPTFSAQYLFGCIIKSTHLGDVPRAKSWDLGAYTEP